MTDKKRPARIDDPHMAQKSAIDALLPVRDPNQPPDPPGLIPTDEIGFEELMDRAVGEYAKEPKDDGLGTYQPELSETHSTSQPFEPTKLARDDELAQLRAMVAHLSAAVDANTAAVRRRGNMAAPLDEGFPWQYYRRPVGGPMGNWVVIAPGGRNSRGVRPAEQYSKYLAKGFKPIESYGVAPKPVSEQGWRSFVPMLRNGGAVEFPVSQVLAYKWHLKPPIANLKFPQLNGIKVLHALCEECEWEMFSEEADMNISRMLLIHVRKQHDYPRREAVRLIADQGLPPIGRFAFDYDTEAKPVSLGSLA